MHDVHTHLHKYTKTRARRKEQCVQPSGRDHKHEFLYNIMARDPERKKILWDVQINKQERNQPDIVGLDKAFPSDPTSMKWNKKSWRDAMQCGIR